MIPALLQGKPSEAKKQHHAGREQKKAHEGSTRESGGERSGNIEEKQGERVSGKLAEKDRNLWAGEEMPSTDSRDF